MGGFAAPKLRTGGGGSGPALLPRMIYILYSPPTTQPTPEKVTPEASLTAWRQVLHPSGRKPERKAALAWREKLSACHTELLALHWASFILFEVLLGMGNSPPSPRLASAWFFFSRPGCPLSPPLPLSVFFLFSP